MKQNKNISQKQQEKPVLLDSASIVHGVDTPILQTDLAREFQPDKYDTDQALLVNGEWVRFFDVRDSFLKGLMALINNSTTLRNVLNQKTTLTLGDGFLPYKSDNIPYLQTFRKFIQKIFVADNSVNDLNNLIGNVNLNNETLEDVIKKVAFDYWAFGNAFVEFVEAKREGKTVVMMYHVPVHKVAIKKTDETNIIKYIGVSDNWELDQGVNVTQIPIYPKFDNVNGSKRSAVHIKNYCPGFFYWGIPSNIASRFYAELEYRIPKYNIAKFKNGFVPSAILQFFGNMSKEEAAKMVKNVKDSFTDTEKNAKMLVQVLSDEKYKMNATILEDKNDGSYMDLQKIASQGIITGNEFTTALAGFATGGKLGTNQQMRDELEYVTNTTIKPVRRKILQNIINPFIKENQRVGAVDNGLMLSIANMNPISLASQLDANSVLLTDEKREILGFDALDEKGKMQMQNEKTVTNGNNNNTNTTEGSN
jgi:hypothetical protein